MTLESWLKDILDKNNILLLKMLAYILFSNWSVPQETVLNKIKQKQWGLKSNHCDTGVQKKMFAFGQNNQKKVESWKNAFLWAKETS